MLRQFTCAFILFFLLPYASLTASKPQHAVMEGFDGLAKGKGEKYSLTSKGTLGAVPSSAAPVDLATDQAWSIYRRSDNVIFIGTSPDGKLLEVQDPGKVKVAAKVKESFIYAVTGTADGKNVFFASSPDGKVYRMNPDSVDPEVWFDPKEKYIWALLATPDGTLYAATGTHGEIYRITAKGLGQVYYASPTETHFRSLALNKDGSLLAGSADSGFLYRITAKDQATVLANTNHQEVNNISLDAAGTIYFTATGAAKPAKDDKSEKGKDDDEKEDSSDGSELYRLDQSMIPISLVSCDETAHALMLNGPLAWFFPGKEGYAYQVNNRGDFTRLRLSDNVITCALAADDHNFYLVTSNPARLYHLTDTPSPATYLSEVIDTKSFVKWGTLSVAGTNLAQVKLNFRSGNTPKPDSTWSDFAAVATTIEGFRVCGTVAAPSSRYGQAQLQLDTTAGVDQVDMAYLPQNRPPALKTFNVLDNGIRFVPIILPDQPQPPKTPDQIGDGLDTFLHPEKPVYRWVPQLSHGYRTIVWTAGDPDDDDLTYSLAYRPEGTTAWHELAKDLTDSIFSWDTTTWNEGRYEIKLTVSDEKSNPGAGLTDEDINRDLVVNNTPPLINVGAPNAGIWQVDITSALGRLRSVTISRNGKDYNPLPPVDGILDSSSERFTIPYHPGEVLYLKAEDDNGNVSGKQFGN